MGARAVIYARVSSAGDRQSTARQVEDLTAYANGMGYEVVRVFEEKISGARKNRDRLVLQECIAFAREESVGVVLATELSRIGRNAYEVMETIKTLVDSGISLYLQKEQFSLLGPDGKPTMFAPVMLSVLATCAELERENIQHRLQSGREAYRASGGRLGRPSGTAASDDEFLEKHRDVVKLLKKGYPIRKTATLTGKSPSTVQRVQKRMQKKSDT